MSHSFSSEELLDQAEFLRRLARGLLGDPELAEDAVQDTFVVALERPPRDPSTPRSWLSTVLANLVRNRQRKETHRAQRERGAARGERGEEEESLAERLEVQRAVFEAMVALDEPKRATLYLRYYEGLTPAEIAQRQGEPVKTVKSRLHRALEELRMKLDGRFGGERRAWALALAPIARAATGGIGTTAVLGGGMLLKLGLCAALAAVAFGTWRMVSPVPLEGQDVQTSLTEEVAQVVAADPQARTAPSLVTASEAASEAASDRQAVEPVSATGSLLVRVRWESDGQPASGVGLDAWAKNDPAPREQRRRATTDANGEACFEGLAPGPVELRLDRGARREVESVAGELRAVEWIAPTGIDVRGRVVSDAGVPIAGAVIWVEEMSVPWPDPWNVATSSADGSFLARSLGSRLRIGARAKAHHPSASFNLWDLPSSAAGGRTAELVLEAGGQAIAGRVLDPSGGAVEDALVWIGGRGRTSGPEVVTTNERGEFAALGRFGAGAHDVFVLARGFPAWCGDVEVSEEGGAWIDIALESSGTVSGRVTLASGDPAAGAEVEVEALGEDIGLLRVGNGPEFTFRLPRAPASKGTTDAAGRFAVGWVGGREHSVKARVPEHPELGQASAELVLDDGKDTTLDLRLDPGQSIEGRVVDASGLGLENWFVEAVAASRRPGTLQNTRTDELGRFRFFNLERCAYELMASHPEDRARSGPDRLSARPGDRDLELVIAERELPTASVQGVFLDPDGRPALDVRPILRSLDGGVTQVGLADPRTGAFRWAGVRGGRYAIQASRMTDRVVAMGEPFELQSGAVFDAGTLSVPRTGALELWPPSELMPGEVPWSSRLVRDGFGSIFLVREGERLRADDLAPGTWWLQTWRPGWFVADRALEIRAGETTTLAVEAEPALETRLVLDVEQGIRETSDLTVEIRNGAGELLARERELRDILRLAWPAARPLSLPAGEIVIDAWTSTGLRGRVEGTVYEGMAPLELSLR